MRLLSDYGRGAGVRDVGTLLFPGSGDERVSSLSLIHIWELW